MKYVRTSSVLRLSRIDHTLCLRQHPDDIYISNSRKKRTYFPSLKELYKIT